MTKAELPLDQVLVRDLSLPLAAGRDLRRVLEFEMDRYTPFTAQQVWFDARILSRDARADRLEVRLVAVRREVAAPLLEGGAPFLGVAGLDGIRLGPRRPPDRVRLALTGLCGLLAALAVAQPFWRQQDHDRALAERAAALAPAAARAETLQTAIAESLKRESLPLTRRRARPGALAVLADLSARLPDDAWLHHLSLGAEGVELTGLAGSAQAVLGLVEDSPLFAKAAFAAPVAQEDKGERFVLRAEWEARP